MAEIIDLVAILEAREKKPSAGNSRKNLNNWEQTCYVLGWKQSVRMSLHPTMYQSKNKSHKSS